MTSTPAQRKAQLKHRAKNKKQAKTASTLPVIAQSKPRPKPRRRKLVPGTLAWAFSFFPGGQTTALLFLRLAAKDKSIDDPNIDKFLKAYDKLPKVEKEDPWSLDETCALVGFLPKSFIAYVTASLFEARGHVDEFVRYMASLDLYTASYKEGMKPRGFKDRTAILQQEGLHYAPKGQSINIDNRRVDVSMEKGLPDFEETVHLVHSALVEDEPVLELPESSAIELELEAEKEKVTA